jgi:hypothetical protein
MFGRIRKFVEDADDTYHQSALLPLGINPTTQNHSIPSQETHLGNQALIRLIKNSQTKKLTQKT